MQPPLLFRGRGRPSRVRPRPLSADLPAKSREGAEGATPRPSQRTFRTGRSRALRHTRSRNRPQASIDGKEQRPHEKGQGDEPLLVARLQDRFFEERREERHSEREKKHIRAEESERAHELRERHKIRSFFPPQVYYTMEFSLCAAYMTAFLCSLNFFTDSVSNCLTNR